jgi:hypothetical protein
MIFNMKDFEERKKQLLDQNYVLVSLPDYGKTWFSVKKGESWEYLNLENPLPPKYTKQSSALK